MQTISLSLTEQCLTHTDNSTQYTALRNYTGLHISKEKTNVLFTVETSPVRVTLEDNINHTFPFKCPSCSSKFLHKYQIHKRDPKNCQFKTPIPTEPLMKKSKTCKILQQQEIQTKIIQKKPKLYLYPTGTVYKFTHY